MARTFPRRFHSPVYHHVWILNKNGVRPGFPSWKSRPYCFSHLVTCAVRRVALIPSRKPHNQFTRLIAIIVDESYIIAKSALRTPWNGLEQSIRPLYYRVPSLPFNHFLRHIPTIRKASIKRREPFILAFQTILLSSA